MPGTTNVRDLGGHPGRDGGVVAHGRLLRGEVLGRPEDGSRQGEFESAAAGSFRELRLRTIIDLRTDSEVARTPSAWSEATGGNVVRIPFASGAEGADTDLVAQLLAGRRTDFTASDLGLYYVDTLEHHASAFAEVVALLSEPNRLPALVHCSAGKDRTGLAVALVLELLGTPRRRVVDDYAMTGDLRPHRWRAYEDLFRDAGADVQRARALFETPRSSMMTALEHLDRRFGGPEGYLISAGGLDSAVPDNVRRALLVPPRHQRVGL